MGNAQDLFSSEKPDITEAQKDGFKAALFRWLQDPTLVDVAQVQKMCDTSKFSVSTAVLDSMIDDMGRNALQLAVQFNKTAVVSFLLTRGCKARRADFGLVSPMQLAILSENEGIVKMLLETEGVNVLLSSDTLGKSPLHYAIEEYNKNPRLFRMLAEYCSADELNMQTRKGETVIHLAAKTGAVEVLKFYIDICGAGAKLEKAGPEGWTAMHTACKRGHAKFVEALIEAGAKRNITNHIGETPLHVSTYFGHEDCVKAVLVTKSPKRLNLGDKEQPIVMDSSIPSGKKLLEPPPPAYEREDDIILEFRDVFGNPPLLYALGYHEPEAFPHRKEKPNRKTSAKSPASSLGEIGGDDSKDKAKKKTPAGRTFRAKKPMSLETIELLLKYEAWSYSCIQVKPEILDELEKKSLDASSASTSTQESKEKDKARDKTPKHKRGHRREGSASPSVPPDGGSKRHGHGGSPTGLRRHLSAEHHEHRSKSAEKTRPKAMLLSPDRPSSSSHKKPRKSATAATSEPVQWAPSVHWPNNDGISPYTYAKSIAIGGANPDLVKLLKKYSHSAVSLDSIIPRQIDSSSNCFELQIASDLHIEFLTRYDDDVAERRMKALIVPKAKYLALLGDIGVPGSGKGTPGYVLYRKFLRHLATQFERVLVLTGNHEYYHGSISETDALVREICEEEDVRQKLVFLSRDRKNFVLEDVRIAGCTLWSHVPETYQMTVGYHLNDYRRIRTAPEPPKENAAAAAPGSPKPDIYLKVTDTCKMFDQDVKYLKAQIRRASKENQSLVILTHHSPVLGYGSSNPEFWSSTERNAFGTDLRHMFGAPVATWIYGHTHWFHDMVLKGTRVVANQGGYPGNDENEYRPYYNKSFVVRIHKYALARATLSQESTKTLRV